MTEAELMQFLFWMEYHQPTDQQIATESLLYNCRGTMETVRAALTRLQSERDEARREVCDWMNTDESGCVKSGSEETAISRGWDCYKETP